MRREFNAELEKLHVEFHRMGGLVSQAVQSSSKAFIEHDIKLADQVIANDERINQMEIALEKKCIQHIALQSPVAMDLRRVITVMKASADLERMGDHAVSIAKSTKRIKGKNRIPAVEIMLQEMALEVQANLRLVLDAYVQSDVETATRVAEYDMRVDDMRRRIRDVVIEYMVENQQIIESATEYLQVANYLERISDYATNVAEWIIYLYTGELAELNQD